MLLYLSCIDQIDQCQISNVPYNTYICIHINYIYFFFHRDQDLKNVIEINSNVPKNKNER